MVRSGEWRAACYRCPRNSNEESPLRSSVILLALVFGAAPALAQSDLQKRFDAKLAEAWFKANDWTSDYDVARKRSRERGKLMFAYFTRSYAE